jgi:8-oxo-dGTP pyrophosphatase MutT (NUDIX family)
MQSVADTKEARLKRVRAKDAEHACDLCDIQFGGILGAKVDMRIVPPRHYLHTAFVAVQERRGKAYDMPGGHVDSDDGDLYVKDLSTASILEALGNLMVHSARRELTEELGSMWWMCDTIQRGRQLFRFTPESPKFSHFEMHDGYLTGICSMNIVCRLMRHERLNQWIHEDDDFDILPLIEDAHDYIQDYVYDDVVNEYLDKLRNPCKDIYGVGAEEMAPCLRRRVLPGKYPYQVKCVGGKIIRIYSTSHERLEPEVVALPHGGENPFNSVDI